MSRACRRPLGGRQAPEGHRPPARSQPQAADPDQPRRAAVRRRPVGRAGPVGARPVRRPDARARRRGPLRPGPPGRGAGGERRRRGSGSSSSSRPRRSSGRRSSRRSARPRRRLPADALARHLVGGLTVAESGLDLGRAQEVVADRRGDRRRLDLRPAAAAELAVHPRLVVLDLRRRLDQPDVLAGPAARGLQHGRHLPRPPDVPRRSRSSSGIRPLGDDDRFRIEDFGRASLEGGDVEIIGRGTVAIGMSERTTGRMIEQIALALFEKGAAERVIAAVMTKDRAHMHLDTVFTLLDRDKATAYPKVVERIRAISLRPGSKPGHARRPRGQGLPVGRRRRARRHEAARRRDRRRRLPAGARAVGRRQQRRRARARRGRRLRAQHVHDLEDARGRGRGHHDRGVRARQGTRRGPLHDLSGRARSDLRRATWTAGSAGSSRSSSRLAIIALVAFARGDAGHDDLAARGDRQRRRPDASGRMTRDDGHERRPTPATGREPRPCSTPLIPVVALVGLIGADHRPVRDRCDRRPLQVALFTSAVVAALVAFKNGHTDARRSATPRSVASRRR